MFESIQELVNKLPDDERENISDWYHTFKELYNHRVTLFVALCNTLELHNESYRWWKEKPWKSKLHSDWTMWKDWFIAWIWNKPWKTLTYHLPISEWYNLHVDELERWPEWDWHTSNDVLNLLRNL